jgi:hypothetical protein
MKKILLLCLVLLCLSGCADKVSFEITQDTTEVGFFHGFWHGMIMPIAWFVLWFSDDVAIYAIYNNGIWYNLGFILGTGAVCGGGSSATRRR